jgi:hypothetical protein
MLKNFKKGFNGNCKVKLIPSKLKTYCEKDCPAFIVGWTLEGSSDKVIVSKIFEVVVREPGHPDQFPYIDFWQDAVLSQPTKLRPCLEEACRVTAASKCSEKPEKLEKLIFVEDPKEVPLPYAQLYPTLPPPFAHLPPPLEGEATSDREALEANIPSRPSPGSLESSTTPTSLGPLNLMLMQDCPLGSTRNI